MPFSSIRLFPFSLPTANKTISKNIPTEPFTSSKLWSPKGTASSGIFAPPGLSWKMLSIHRRQFNSTGNIAKNENVCTAVLGTTSCPPNKVLKRTFPKFPILRFFRYKSPKSLKTLYFCGRLYSNTASKRSLCTIIYFFLTILFLIVLTISMMHSCANMASPTGGLYDENPPVVLKTTPEFNSNKCR